MRAVCGFSKTRAAERAGARRLSRPPARPGRESMGTLATSTELWTAVGTTIATAIFLVPGLVYAWYVLESWIGDRDSYERVIASLDKR
jgi:hypothetical protein